MGARGPKSAAELSVVPIGGPKPPRPPEELTKMQAEEWRAIVKRMPSDWFTRETWPLLAQLCRHTVQSRRIAKLIEELLSDFYAIDDYDRLLRMQNRESAAIMSLSTKLRLSQQSSYNAKNASTAKTGPDGKRPWEYDREIDPIDL